MKRLYILLPLLFALQVAVAEANPGLNGSTGLFTVPTADTLDAGNFCLGVWGSVRKKYDRHAITVPVGITMGVGSYWEVYGGYPNLIGNNQEPLAFDNAATVGTKLRFLGKRSDKVKAAIDFFGERHLTSSPDTDGTTDMGARLIGSYTAEKYALHVSGGYLWAGATPTVPRDNSLLYGLGAEYILTMRSRLMMELRGQNPISLRTSEKPIDATLGLQYYITPHLTFYLAGSADVRSPSNGMRITSGFSTCQGIGTYVKPIAAPGLSAEEKRRRSEASKARLVPITPLLLKVAATPQTVSKLEVPVESGEEEIVLRPAGKVVMPSQQAVGVSTKYAPLRPQQAQAALGRTGRSQAQQAGGQPVSGRAQQQSGSGVGVSAGKPLPDQPPVPMPIGGTEAGKRIEESYGEVKVSGSEGSVDLMEGVTPLYGIEIKEGKQQLIQLVPSQPEIIAPEQVASPRPAQPEPAKPASIPVPPALPVPAPASQPTPVTQPVPSQPIAVQPVITQPAPVPGKMLVYRKFRFSDSKFEFDTSDLSDEVKRSISQVAELIRNDKSWTYIRIDGHTDNIGSVDYNMDLSLKRAIAVASYLIAKEGIDPAKIFVKGMGKSKMIADNATPEGRRTNRRVEILFLVPRDK